MSDAIKWKFCFSAEMGHLDDKNVDFKYVVLSLNWKMVNIHYHLKYQDITDHTGDNKLWLFQSIQMVVFATEMGYLDDKASDFEHGVLFLDSLMVHIHYHLKCQEITDNEGDNKLWLMQSIQMVVFATDMGRLDDNRLELKHGALWLDSLMKNLHYHFKCQDITENAGDNKHWLFHSI